MKTRIEVLQEAATENGVINIDKYTELVVGDSVAAVLNAEIRLSSFLAALIEEQLDYKQKHFDNDWFVKNYIQKAD